ncbi:MAG TPA: replication initiation factor domain-containing protein [Candidatus Paceibacterota bacterium]
MYTRTVVRESQPDWLTVGAHRAKAVRDLADFTRSIAEGEQADGNKTSDWRLLGYEGYRTGRVRYGEARGWAIAQLSGDLASTWLRPMVTMADSVSRLDLAVTVATDQPDPNAGRILYEQAREWRLTHPKAAKPWFIGGDETGWTTYIGKRESDWFLRCYDKAAETREDGDPELIDQYKNAWRYELEIKGQPAQLTAEQLLRSGNIHNASNALVYAWLSHRGCEPPWTPDQPIQPVGTLRRRSDRDRKLLWLQTQVRPTVEWLSQNGDLDAVKRALGIALGPNLTES